MSRPGPRRRRVRHHRRDLGHHHLALAEFGCDQALATRSWIFLRDPDFAGKAKRVLDLYARVWAEPLGADDYVISCDEKTSIQARCRCHPTLPPGRSRTMRVEHDYDRGGALAYLTAYDVHRAHVIGRCAPTTGITPFMALVEQVMTQEPYASARRVFWVVDNGSSHRGDAARATRRRLPHRGHGAHPDPRVVAEPGGDLLLDRPAQSRGTQRLHRPRAVESNRLAAFESASTPPRPRSNGSSPQTTSMTSSPGSTDTSELIKPPRWLPRKPPDHRWTTTRPLRARR